MVNIPFFKKLSLPTFSTGLFASKPEHVAGIDIGTLSTKVVQLRYERERAILETYGELLNGGYTAEHAIGRGIQQYGDNELAELVRDLCREANVKTKEVIFSVPASASFITTISFPHVSEKEIEQAIPYEARKYVPIPVAEVILDWDILTGGEKNESIEVLLVAVPKEIIEKYKRIAELCSLSLLALEVETFSILRALGGSDLAPTVFINIGAQSTAIAISDRGELRLSHTFARGSHELTKALERGLGISGERAETIKREIGLSEKIEDRETISVMTPFVETLFTEIERFVSIYNRRAPRTIQRINLTGGGSNLKGLIEYAASKFGVEVTKGNPFARVVTPPFIQPLLREIGSNFSVAVGLALRELTNK